jgi:alpha-L-rhamnosidase
MKKMILMLSAAAVFAGQPHVSAAEKSDLVPVFLRCEYHENPLATDVAKPRLSWILRHGGPLAVKPDGGIGALDHARPRGLKQTAYQILVASSAELLAADKGDLWDSGGVKSDQSVHIIYAGKPLRARQQAHWKVRITDQDGKLSDWSAPATWVMGVMGDWKSPWIASRDVPMKRPIGQDYVKVENPPGNFEGTAEVRREGVFMRRDVTLEAKPVRALARISGLGFADLSINGQKAGDHVVSPAVTDYTRRVFYDTHDVAGLFNEGENTLGAVLGNGFYSTPGRGWAQWFGVGNEPVFSVEIELTMPGGAKKFLTSDKSWKWSTAEITFNDYFVGEFQDLRLAQPGWDRPGFDDAKWLPVVEVKAPPGEMQANPGTPVRVVKEVKPARVEGNRYIFDHMQTGWPVVKASGPAGREVKVGDHGKPRGQGAAWNPGGNSADFKFILRGEGVETLEPRFMVHSIGPVISVDGIDPPPADAVSIKSAHADLRVTGGFSCSNPFLNHVHEATLRTHLNYTLEIPMDPTREKAGWMQDVQTMIDSTIYLTDIAALYRRWWTDMSQSQLPDGSVGSVVPMVWGGQENCWNDPWWSGMIIYLPYKHHLYYGDREILETAYEPMKAYLEWLAGRADKNDGLLRWAGASDWIEVGIEGWGPPKRTPTHLVSTCAWYHYTDMMSRIAKTLGKTADAGAYAADAVRIRDNFNKHLLDPETGLYAGAKDSQTSLILPLALGMVPEDKKDLVIRRLAENIEKRGNHLSTGFVGTPHLMEAMTDLGLGEQLYKIITQQDHPGWNTLITDGVMKETWKGGLVQMPSLGGSIGQWFYKVAAGIQPDPAAPGFKRIVIRPAIKGDLTWVKCGYDSNYGPIVSHWQREDSKLTMDVVIPPNTSARIHVPAKDAASVTESGKPAGEADGVKFLGMEKGAAVYGVYSGTYRFQSTLP